MRLGISAFLTGIVVLAFYPGSPGVELLMAVPLVILMVLKPRWRFLLLLPLGFAWAWWYAQANLDHQLPSNLEGKDILLQGVVVTLPKSDKKSVRFGVEIQSGRQGTRELTDLPHLVRLGWYRTGMRPGAGEKWQFLVRMKRPHGMHNPGGFDYEGWLFRNGYGATGYVRPSKLNKKLAEPNGLNRLHAWRQSIAEQIVSSIDDVEAAGILAALAVGDRRGISRFQWELLTATGTNHLVAISGLHIGLVAAMVFFVSRRLWGLSTFCVVKAPAPIVAAVFASIAALVYAGLAGFSLPTLRALVMLAVVMGAILLRTPVKPINGIVIAALAVLGPDPMAALAPGFWLSFGAVVVLFYGLSGRIGRSKAPSSWMQAQWVVALGLSPLLLLMFRQTSIVSPLANALAIPLIGLIVVPLVLLATLLMLATPVPLDWIWWLPEKLVLLALHLLGYLSDLPGAVWYQPIADGWVFLFTLAGTALVLAPRGLPGRWLASFMFLPIVLVRPPTPLQGEVWMDVLDVGQGLSVVIRTSEHNLLYDTGPGYGKSFNAGSAAVVPYLRANGISKLDRLILSHGDNDHAGGLASVVDAIPIDEILTGSPERVSDFNPITCTSENSWEWDNVRFRIIYPPPFANLKGNHATCVLLVESEYGNLLIPGDIEKKDEAWLLQNAAEALQASVLIAPHHGSKTSSTPNFLAAVNPTSVVFSAGYRNRFKLPAAEVVERYRLFDSEIWNTARHGAVMVRPGATGFSLISYRQANPRIWAH